MVEHTGILTQVQGGFRQDKSTDINTCKLYGIDIDFKSDFKSMSQASLWVILEMYNIPDIDLFKSLYEHTTQCLVDPLGHG